MELINELYYDARPNKSQESIQSFVKIHGIVSDMEPADGRADLTTFLMLSAMSVVCSVSIALPCHKLNNCVIQPSGRTAPGKTTTTSFLRAEGWKDWSVEKTECLDVGDMSFPKFSSSPFHIYITGISVKNIFKFCLVPALWLACSLACTVQKCTECTTSKLRSCSSFFFNWQAKVLRIWCLVVPAVDKKNTNLRDAVNTTERLSITLGFPATVDSYHNTRYCTGWKFQRNQYH